MFESLFGTGKRSRVHAALTNRMNHTCMTEIHGNARGPNRSAFCRIVFLIEPMRGRKWDFENAFPVVTRDISPDGIALIHWAPMTHPDVLIALTDTDNMSFVRCSVQHCTSLGYGFHQIGLYAEEVVTLAHHEVLILIERMDLLEQEMGPERFTEHAVAAEMCS